MAFFDDMTAALAEYPVTDVELEIVEVNIPGDVLNTGEEASFKVRVTNRGPLNLSGVKVHVFGRNGALVKGAGAIDPFEADFISGEMEPIEADGGSQVTAGLFRLRAPSGAQASKTLVKATLEAWDADLDYILKGSSTALDVPKGTFAAPVVAS